MIKAEFKFKPGTDEITRVCITGHAGQSEYGHDLICAGVSTLTIATINGLEKYVDISPKEVVTEGYIEFSVETINEKQALQAQALVHSFYMAMLDLQEENNKFVRVKIMEEKI